jgi:large subunit ribosomal protein L5
MKNYNDLYKEVIVPNMQEKFAYSNVMEIPKITKVVINIGVGQSQVNPKILQVAENTLITISGQKPKYCLSKKAISGFKLRQGQKVGLAVTLRGKKMQDFIYRLIHIDLPRIRDFRGLDSKGFDHSGNYNIGIKEQIVFPEIKYDEVELTHGMEITIVTSAKNDEQASELLTLMGFPFKKN